MSIESESPRNWQEVKQGAGIFLFMGLSMALVCWVSVLMEERDKQNQEKGR